MEINKKHASIIGICIIVIFLLASALIAYATSWQDPISVSFKKLYPAAFVGGKIISIAETDEFINLARKTEPSISYPQALQVYLDHEKSEVLLDRLNLKLPSDAVSDELNFYKKSNQSTYDQYLQKYFDGKEDLFVDNVVEPTVIEAELKIKYNSDYNLNQAAYQKAESVLEQLSQGKTFDELAPQYSDDKQSAQFGGDLGFFEHGTILPELEKEITVAKVGEVHDIIVTRDGYEIVEPIETSTADGKKMWHAKHILIQTNGFEQWLTNQTQNISVKIIKKY